MKSSFAFFFLLSSLLLVGCGASSKRSPGLAAVKQFDQQLAATCSAGGTYHKRVLSEGVEEKTFSLSDTCLLQEELSYVFQFCWQDPKISGQLSVAQVGDSTVATVLPDYAKKLDLKRQVAVMNKEGKLTYLATTLSSSSWLYKQYVQVVVHFDSLGLYQSHTLKIDAEQPWSKKHFSGIIEGIRK